MDEREAKAKADMEALLGVIQSKRWFDSSRMLWKDRTEEAKIKLILTWREVIQNDLDWRKTIPGGTLKGGAITNQEISHLIYTIFSENNMNAGQKAYAEYLFKSFGIDV